MLKFSFELLYWITCAGAPDEVVTEGNVAGIVQDDELMFL